MCDKKVIAVVGATGQQGGAVVQAILADGPNSHFVARAITRDASSAKALELKKQGVEVAEADVYNTEALTKAIKGCYGMFCVTNLTFDESSPAKEIAQAKSMAAAAKSAGIEHVIWSTLEDTRKFAESAHMPTLYGKYKVPHMDAKGEADKVFAEAKLPTTYLVTSFFWNNLLDGMGARKFPDGKYYLAAPMGKRLLAGIGSEDIGKCAFGLFKRPDYIGKRVGIAGEHLTFAEITEKMSKVLGKEIVYHDVPADVFRGFDFPGAHDLGNMFQIFHDRADAFVSVRNIDESRKLNPQLLDFDNWLAKHKNDFHLPQ